MKHSHMRHDMLEDSSIRVTATDAVHLPENRKPIISQRCRARPAALQRAALQPIFPADTSQAGDRARPTILRWRTSLYAADAARPRFATSRRIRIAPGP